MAIVCFDYGHGGNDPGACYKGRKEKDDNLQIGSLVAKKLREYGVVVDEVRDRDRTLSLKDRSSFERRKNYDFFISFHRNAFKAEKARGVETYIFLNEDKKAKELAESIQNGLVKVGFVDRGVKRESFHVLRETRAPAILIELGFIDNSSDNRLFLDRNREIVDTISRSILECLKIDAIASISGEENYRVVAGSFRSKDNAQKMSKSLKEAGFESFIVRDKK